MQVLPTNVETIFSFCYISPVLTGLQQLLETPISDRHFICIYSYALSLNSLQFSTQKK